MSGAVERLRQLGAVAIERVGLQREPPGQHVGRLAVLDRRVVRHVDGLGDRAGDEGLRRRHHADVALDREIALADAPAGIGAVEHRQSARPSGCGAPSSVIAPQTWMLAASISACEKPRCVSRSKDGSSSCSAGTLSAPVRKSSPSVHLLKTNLMSKAEVERRLAPASIFSSVKPRALSERVVDGRAPGASVPWPTA